MSLMVPNEVKIAPLNPFNLEANAGPLPIEIVIF